MNLTVEVNFIVEDTSLFFFTIELRNKRERERNEGMMEMFYLGEFAFGKYKWKTPFSEGNQENKNKWEKKREIRHFDCD